MIGCSDCGLLHGSDQFPDLIIPDQWWKRISPHGDEGGTLCPNCIVGRLEKWLRREGIAQRMHIPAAFTSGPLRTISPELMATMRWTEMLRGKVSPDA